MPTLKVDGIIKVDVDVREVITQYINEKVMVTNGHHLSTKTAFAFRDLADLVISLGKERGIKIRISFNDK